MHRRKGWPPLCTYTYTIKTICFSAKSKLAPIKTLAIPRLELCAALLLANLLRSVAETIDIDFESIDLYTNSRIVLAWLDHPLHELKIFVANRVAQIQTLTSKATWRHVQGTDLGSRGISADKSKTSDLWWYGPRFSSLPYDEWPLKARESLPIDQLPETRPSIVLNISEPEPKDQILRMFSSTVCHRLNAKPIQPIMAVVIPDRLRTTHCWASSAIDFGGPIATRESNLRKITLHKIYICVFVCLTTRAIHLEMVTDLTAAAFLAAYHRFTTRRSVPDVIYSDRGSNFTRSRKVLRECKEFLKSNYKTFFSAAAAMGTKWLLNVPYRPNFNGIKSAKALIKRQIGEHVLTFEEFATLLCRVEQVLNSRSIAFGGSEINDKDVYYLTPGHFIVGRDMMTPPEEIAPENASLRDRWKRVQQMSQLFWKTWSTCYLHELMQRQKWTKATGNLGIGSLAYVTGEKTTPLSWPVGRVVDTYSNPCDQTVRVARVRVEASKQADHHTYGAIHKEVKPQGFERENFQMEQIFYQGKDGTKIPMFLVHKKGLVKNHLNPCLLYGYGGFNISIKPFFNVTMTVFVKHLNGVLAIANIRGGGEYGDKWHNQGRFENRQTSFNDFQEAAEYLIKTGYTSSKYLTIKGDSNGGLLVSTCAVQRPDLFGAVCCGVGLMDMLRFQKFTIGSAWVSDYGCSDVKEQFEYLYKYSPLHNVKVPPEGVQYPAMLLATADHDDRVVPLHSLKFIATIQHIMKNCPYQKNPLLVRVDVKAGHGAGKPTSKLIQEATDLLCFIIQSLSLEFKP